MQTAVQDLLKAFENSTSNNNPTVDFTTANYPFVDANDAAAAAYVGDDNVVNNDAGEFRHVVSLAAVNTTQNNDATTAASYGYRDHAGSDDRQAEGTVTSHVANYQRQNQNQSVGSARRGGVGLPSMAGAGPTMRRSTSQSHVQRGRSLSNMENADRQRPARNALSAASVVEGLARRRLDSSQHPYRRCSSSSSHHHQQQQQQWGRESDRLSRQTSRQHVVTRRRSDLPLTV